ncbi:MAG: hypothetical protein IV100_14855 [Myxococcales bacterium]|nr:hypothetical protein [Myxococcales bacterium]
MSVQPMRPSPFARLVAREELSDAEVTALLAAMVRRERLTLAAMLRYLGLALERKLYAPAGYDCVSAYFVDRFGWSLPSAQKRLQAADEVDLRATESAAFIPMRTHSVWIVVVSAVVAACSGDELQVGSTYVDAASTGDAASASNDLASDVSPSSDTGPEPDATDDAASTDPEPDISAPVDSSEERDIEPPMDVTAPVDTREGDIEAMDPDVVAVDVPAPPDVAPDVSPPIDVGPPGPMTFASCFQGQFPSSGVPTVDYDGYAPVVGSHCKGTNHQDIQGVERVVFVGDSITVGTPPTLPTEWYRVVMAKSLATTFGLTAPDAAWENVDLVNGVTYAQASGDFWSCAKWGARTDDLTDKPHEQLITCNPEAERQKRTLVVMTAGGNDLFSWAQDLVSGVPVADLWLLAEKAVQDLDDSIHWLVDDPTRFPNGVYVVFGNTYEFTDTDSGNDLASCPGANLIGMDTALIDPDFVAMATWMAGEYMRIAVETKTDMAFFGELTCGHGHMNDNPEGRCYRGPGTSLWLDITCMHPSAAGHAGIADMFLATIGE